MRKMILPALLLAAGAASAVELSLEENRAERGNIGFIDMKKVFTLYPETARARENFEEALRQAEEQVNLRKTELLRLRAELAQMKTDREVLAAAPTQTPAPAAAPAPLKIIPKAPEPAPAAAPPPAPAEAAPVQAPASPSSDGPAAVPAPSTGAASASQLPGMTQPLTIQLPGSDSPTVVQEPGSPAAEEPSFQGESGKPLEVVKPLDSPVPTPQDPVTAAPVIETPSMAPVPETPLQLMDKRIAEREAEIKRKETEYKQHRAGAEKNLLDLEARRSEILLGKIYRAVQEVARKEGVSVVVDKTAILYGHGAVDITEKVLKALKGA